MAVVHTLAEIQSRMEAFQTRVGILQAETSFGFCERHLCNQIQRSDRRTSREGKMTYPIDASQITKEDAERLYKEGSAPEITDLQGKWKVTMWGNWRAMRHDRKIINGNRGHNIFLRFIPWGWFTLLKVIECVDLKYDNGKIWDYVRIHPDYDGLAFGRFCYKGKYLAPFMLEKYDG